jgi:hypothetical protein
MIGVIASLVHGDGNGVFLQQRIGLPVEIISPIIKSHSYAAGWKFPSLEAPESLCQRQNGTTTCMQSLEPLLEDLRGEVKCRSPAVLILQRDAVIAQNQQPLASPFAVSDSFKGSRALEEPERS